jgi:hypothetical protein
MDQLLLRTSERSSFKTCEQQWLWSYVDRWKPKISGNALRFGDLVHRALADYYPLGLKRGPHPVKTFRRIYSSEFDEAAKAGFRDADGKWLELKELGECMLEGYVDFYKDTDKEFKVLATEQTFKVPIRNKRGKVVAWYVGTVDGLFQNRQTGRLLIRDYKTTGKFGHFEGPLSLNDQAGAYWTFGVDWLVKKKAIKPSMVSDIEKMEYRFLKKTMPDQRKRNADGHCLNQDGTISKNQPSPLFWDVPVYRTEQNRDMIRQRVLTEIEVMAQIRDGEREPMKNPGPLHLPNCSGCGYKDMCELHEAGADWKEFRDGTMMKWDPYEAHSDYQL